MCFAAGLAGGGGGSLVGIGGGAIMVPLMTGFARMTQHQAVGTSSAAVAGTGMAAAVSFGSAGAVDFVAAAALASTAMLTARLGARFTKSFSPVALQRAFACFQCAVAPMVPLKAQLMKSSRTADEAVGATANDSSDDGATSDQQSLRRTSSRARIDQWRSGQQPQQQSANGADTPRHASPPAASDALQALSSDRATELFRLAIVGCAAGFAAGMFGIGGGVVLTPALCLLTDMPHACVLGTTLASMVPPSLVSAGTHAQMGNVVGGVVAPLVVGSAMGAFAGGQLVLQLPEEPLQWGFAIFCLASGGHKLWSLRGKI